MATKKHKKPEATSDDVPGSTDECVRTIEAALEAMSPPIEVYDGILRLIAEFAEPCGKWRVANGQVLDGEGFTT